MTDDMNNAPPVETTAETMNTDANKWAMMCHLGGLVGLLIFPLNYIIPLIIWIKHRDEFPLVNDQGMEALNFQISITIYTIIFSILILVIIGIFLLIALFFFVLVVGIVASVQASRGVSYRYPLIFRLIR